MVAIWNWLITPPTTGEVVNPLTAAYLVVFLVGFVASTYSLRSEEAIGANTDRTLDRARPCARIGLFIFGTGLVFFAVRALQIDPLLLSAPIWMILAVIALIVVGWRCVGAN